MYESIDQGNDVTCLVVPVVLFLFFRTAISISSAEDIDMAVFSSL